MRTESQYAGKSALTCGLLSLTCKGTCQGCPHPAQCPESWTPLWGLILGRARGSEGRRWGVGGSPGPQLMLSHTDPSEGQWFLSPLSRGGNEAPRGAVGVQDPNARALRAMQPLGAAACSAWLHSTPGGLSRVTLLGQDPLVLHKSPQCQFAQFEKSWHLEPGALPRFHLGAFREPSQCPSPSPHALAEWTSVQDGS